MGATDPPKRTPKLWRRKFTRGPGLDVDLPADGDFRKKNFVDYFGRVFLEEHWDKLTYNEVVSHFWESSNGDTAKYRYAIFCAADGAKVIPEQEKDKVEEWRWLNQHVRFVTVVSGNEEEGGNVVPAGPFEGEKNFTIFIVGSESPKSPDRFMDACCWDGQMFQFYARDWMQEPNTPREQWKAGWVYQGSSKDAFGENQYLGPFGGHVNGSLVMKELHKPWPHWYSNENTIHNRFPKWIKKSFTHDEAPWVTNMTPFDQLSTANDLETHIKSGINEWMSSRYTMDFKEFVNGKSVPRQKATGVKRWMAHLLLTTTVNIAVARKADGKNYFVPHNFAYNAELADVDETLEDWFPKTRDKLFMLKNADIYKKVAKDLQIAVYHVLNGPAPITAPVIDLAGGMLGGGKDGPHMTEAIETALGEGVSGNFTMLQPAFEDAAAVLTLMDSNRKPPVMSTDLFLALTMIDTCNPIFSWRRGVLLQYVPDEVQLQQDKKKYDLDTRFVANVKASPRLKDKSSPEAEFVEIWDGLTKDSTSKAKVKAAFQKKMADYWEKVDSRLQTELGIFDYMRLIQSKHRVYRPVPLNEFALTLPIVPNWPDKLPLEMTYDGTVQKMPDRGAKFLMEWTAPLMGPDPKVIPRGDANDSNDGLVYTMLTATAPDHRSMTVDEKELVPCRRRQACPVMRDSEDEVGVSAIGRHFLAMMMQLEDIEKEVSDLSKQIDAVEVKA